MDGDRQSAPRAQTSPARRRRRSRRSWPPYARRDMIGTYSPGRGCCGCQGSGGQIGLPAFLMASAGWGPRAAGICLPRRADRTFWGRSQNLDSGRSSGCLPLAEEYAKQMMERHGADHFECLASPVTSLLLRVRKCCDTSLIAVVCAPPQVHGEQTCLIQ